MRPPKQASRQGRSSKGGELRGGRLGEGHSERKDEKGKEMESVIKETQPLEALTFLREERYDRNAVDRKGYFNQRQYWQLSGVLIVQTIGQDHYA